MWLGDRDAGIAQSYRFSAVAVLAQGTDRGFSLAARFDDLRHEVHHQDGEASLQTSTGWGSFTTHNC